MLTIGLEPITLWEQILSLSCLPVSPSEHVMLRTCFKQLLKKRTQPLSKHWLCTCSRKQHLLCTCSLCFACKAKATLAGLTIAVLPSADPILLLLVGCTCLWQENGSHYSPIQTLDNSLVAILRAKQVAKQ